MLGGGEQKRCYPQAIHKLSTSLSTEYTHQFFYVFSLLVFVVLCGFFFLKLGIKKYVFGGRGEGKTEKSPLPPNAKAPRRRSWRSRRRAKAKNSIVFFLPERTNRRGQAKRQMIKSRFADVSAGGERRSCRRLAWGEGGRPQKCSFCGLRR